MAIQLPDVGTGYPADQTGDSPWLAMKKVRENFANPDHAASKLVGKGSSQIALNSDVGEVAFRSAKGTSLSSNESITTLAQFPDGGTHHIGSTRFTDMPYSYNLANLISFSGHGGSKFQIFHGYAGFAPYNLYMRASSNPDHWMKIYHDRNTTKDSNGMIKVSSPVLRVFSTHIEGNEDGEKMGAKFVKNSVGNYLIKGTTGLADEGWYVTVPQDANGNNLVAVEYESLENGDVVLRTYKRKFNFETVSIVADHDNPLDIPDTRWIDLRFNEIPFETQEELPTDGG